MKSSDIFKDELEKPRDFINKLYDNKVNAMALPVGNYREINKASYNKIVSNYDYNFMTFYGKNTKLTNPHLLYRVNFPQDLSD